MDDFSERWRGQGPLTAEDSLDLANIAKRYQHGLTPTSLVENVLTRIEARGDDRVWIHRLSRDDLMLFARGLEARGPAGKPLYGVPFAIKDNIDLAGCPTTAACPAFAYVARESAPVVQRLVDAGAIPIGKTNLDQFATGLNGTRSPYGAPASAIAADHVSGGSSSGSAVAVAAGLVGFSLGTDTAGSGRVPAAFNNLVGLKPTRGLISTRGVVPACRSLDCVSIFALTADDARDVLAVAKGFDAADPFSRCEVAKAGRPSPQDVKGARFGVPRSGQLEYFGNAEGERLFAAMLRQIERLGGELVEIDFAPFLETARLLYEGPWVAERYVAIRDFIDRQPEALHPITRQIIGGGAKPLAADAFAAYYRLKELRRTVEPVWRAIDVLITPTAGRHYTIAEMLADPIKSELRPRLLRELHESARPQRDCHPGRYSGRWAGVWRDVGSAGLERRGALCARRHSAPGAEAQARRAQPRFAARKRPAAANASDGAVRLAVCGAHMSGLPLNHQLTERGGALRAPLPHRDRLSSVRLAGRTAGPPRLAARRSGRDDRGRGMGAAGLRLRQLRRRHSRPPRHRHARARGWRAASRASSARRTPPPEARDITDLGGWRRYLMAEQTA